MTVVALVVMFAVGTGLLFTGAVRGQGPLGWGLRDWQRRERALRSMTGAEDLDNRDRAFVNVRVVAGGERDSAPKQAGDLPEHVAAGEDERRAA
ncbi:MAG: hypothetical protein GEV03_23110 [Streptosporangiales bacterium]|nr:hypothetical protein [Streptosporangiales bacterium]